ncbi:hypothetical protein [Aquimarina algiphila]|uniref:Secreted protein n=1 Tax=Aquimarina algiphila TaxID=2047982 RepID=A0A554VAX7_9FLAO|nr:hypothetical protein [Aquimarina algiphila]TSE03493.1 hypothetical protein FOF46_29180 [Aquimarina algiphila]
MNMPKGYLFFALFTMIIFSSCNSDELSEYENPELTNEYTEDFELYLSDKEEEPDPDDRLIQ